jgi:hypothetical protein
MTFTGPVVVERINGREIRSLADVVTAFDSNQERFDRLEFESAGTESLEREKAAQAHAEILKQYAIARDRSL